MTQTAVTFPSAGLKLSGVVHVPDDVRPGERRPAFMVLHGFGSNKSSSNTMEPTKVLSSLGYVVLRFDMRGCGESEGERGNLICLEQVEDTSSALTFLAKHPAVDPDRIAVIGSSFGAAVAVYTGGVDPARRRRDLVRRLGRRRAQVPRPASRRRSLEEVHRHAGRGQRLPRQDRQVADGAALRHRADPAAPAHQPGAEFDPRVHVRDRAEHVRFPCRRRGRQDRAAAVAAAALVERLR